MVERLFLAVPWGCLGFVIVVFPDHTHLLFLVEVGYLLLNTKNQGSMPCGFRQEDLKVFNLENLVLACVTYKVDNQWTRTI